MKALEIFLQTLENEAFKESHEVLEVTWREWKNDDVRKEESLILKGLINGATALALFQLGRPNSALQVWSTFEKYRPLIQTLPSSHTRLYQKAQALLEIKYKKIVLQ